MKTSSITREIKSLGDPEKARFARRFFKTGPGQYGYGDKFLGVRVPVLRGLTKKHLSLPLWELPPLLKSPFHEIRLFVFLLLTEKYARSGDSEKEKIFRLVMRHIKYLNNWDLIDSTAPKIIGPHLERGSKAILYQWAASTDMWKRRAAMLSTFPYIKKGKFGHTLKLAEKLLRDPDDLMHKAVGWMLREVGNVDLAAEEAFLKPRFHRMPRTMLRYAIERFPEKKRLYYLKKPGPI